MKKSVIFWNVIGALVILYSYIFNFGHYDVLQKLIQMFSSMATVFVFLLYLMGEKETIKMFEIQKLKKSGFVLWCLFITPLGLASWFGFLCYHLVLKFNKWIDNK